jgi:hypothetical protein
MVKHHGCCAIMAHTITDHMGMLPTSSQGMHTAPAFKHTLFVFTHS